MVEDERARTDKTKEGLLDEDGSFFERILVLLDDAL